MSHHFSAPRAIVGPTGDVAAHLDRQFTFVQRQWMNEGKLTCLRALRWLTHLDT